MSDRKPKAQKDYPKVKISKDRKVPETYVPKSLSPEDRKKQIKSIKEGTK